MLGIAGGWWVILIDPRLSIVIVIDPLSNIFIVILYAEPRRVSKDFLLGWIVIRLIEISYQRTYKMPYFVGNNGIKQLLVQFLHEW